MKWIREHLADIFMLLWGVLVALYIYYEVNRVG